MCQCQPRYVLGADHLISGGGGGGVEENVPEHFIYFFPVPKQIFYFTNSEKQIFFSCVTKMKQFFLALIFANLRATPGASMIT